MTCKVDLSEVNTLASKIETTSHVLENDLHNVMQQLDELIGLDSFQGDTASHAKKYFENVHQTAIQSIQFIAHELATNMKTHIETFKQDVDSNDHARIEYAYLQEIKENVQSLHTQVGDSVQSISQSLESISDIIDVEPPQMADLETSKSNLDHTIDQLCNDVELFTAKGSEHDEEMKEMLHQVETLMTEAQSQNGEGRFTITETSSMNQSLSFLTEANLILENRQADRRKNVIAETQRESFSKLSEAMEISTKQVKYAKKPNSIVELSQVIVDVVKGTASAVYHLGEDFVLGIVQIVEDLPGTLEALGSMIAHPIETAKYIGKGLYDSFIRDVIHGDAESRAHWFTYAIGSIFGFKGLDKAGKVSVQAAKQGTQKAGQKLDELLPYHPKHQLAMDGPVPYNVYDGINLRDQLMVKAENVSRQEKGLRSKDKSSGKGTSKETYQHLKDYKNNKYFTRSVEYSAGKDGTGFTYKVYQREDINWDMVRTKGAKKGRGLTNAEASAKYGLAPILDDAGSVATLHHSQQKGVGPLYEASTRYHNISNAKRAPLHPYKGKLNPFYPMDETTRGAFQKVDSINYWKIRGEEALGGK